MANSNRLTVPTVELNNDRKWYPQTSFMGISNGIATTTLVNNWVAAQKVKLMRVI